MRACEDAVVHGTLPGDTECGTHAPTAAAVAKAAARLERGIAKACAGKDKTCGTLDDDDLAAVGWSLGACPDLAASGCANPIASCGDVDDCLACLGGRAVEEVRAVVYGSLAPTDRKTQKRLHACQRAIGKAAVAFLAAKSKALLRCWLVVNQAGAGKCPDARADKTIAAAAAKRDAAIAKACQGPDRTLGTADDFTPGEIGFATPCLDGAVPACGVPVTRLADLIDCVGCVTGFDVDCVDRAAIPAFAAYPAACNAGPAPSPTPTGGGATPTPTRTATPAATTTPSGTATPTVTPTPSRTATPTPSRTATPTPSRTATPTPSRTATPTPTAVATPGTFLLDAVDSGFYRDDGEHEAHNYAVGWFTSGGGIELRDYFVFDLSGVTGTITSAVLTVDVGPTGYGSADASETFALFAVATALPTLAGGTGGTAAFADLADGTAYGEAVVTNAVGATVAVTLNAAGIAFLEGSAGEVALGGAITTLAKGGANEFLFNSTGLVNTRRLTITTQ